MELTVSGLNEQKEYLGKNGDQILNQLGCTAFFDQYSEHIMFHLRLMFYWCRDAWWQQATSQIQLAASIVPKQLSAAETQLKMNLNHDSR